MSKNLLNNKNKHRIKINQLGTYENDISRLMIKEAAKLQKKGNFIIK